MAAHLDDVGLSFPGFEWRVGGAALLAAMAATQIRAVRTPVRRPA